ncbi:SDR family NAD(P)-dependent oxidoreductase [Aquihabitans sp. G128]|uniref:SDR family NAD(P)-dependent oxidoreductase n=1 Tax=Aquihabitans sp. G128 TaxID=2849779 RepID=UPI001C218B5E|nr:SDR family NAD(P)-dependent oxidoreductase [Aquihabitans sp. G128]QXC62074.1 SDR family NAD(P)-dependent oxidoreductase [Aquihabitans sp. G128]
MVTPVPFALPADQLAGRVAVVTGASRGLGAGLAARFAEHGMDLALCARTEPTLPAGATGLTAAVDVTDAAAVDAFADRVVDEVGPVALWVNNAGVLQPIGPHRDHDPSEVDRALLVNVGGVANGTRAFTRVARADATAGSGRPVLVNVTSGAATSVYEGWSIYGACKAAVDHLTRTVAAEEPALACWAVAPGIVETGMQALIRSQDAASFPAVERFRQIHADGSANAPAWVADHLAGLVAGTWAPDDVVARIPNEHG